LRDRVGRQRILARVARLVHGNFGDRAPVGEGVHELRLFFGPSALSMLEIGVGYCRKFRDTFENTEVSHEQEVHCPTFG